MNRCESYQEQLHDWIDGELDRELAIQVARHVEECDLCENAVRSIRSVKNLLRSKGRDVELPPRLEARVRESIALESLRNERSKRVSLSRQRLLWGSAAALIIVAVAGLTPIFNTPNLHAGVTKQALVSHMNSIHLEDQPRFHCISREEAQKSLHEQLGQPVQLPIFVGARVCLRGVSIHHFDQIRVGKVHYLLDGHQFSLFVVPVKIRTGTTLCCCHAGQELKVFCSNEGDYCFTYVTKNAGRAISIGNSGAGTSSLDRVSDRCSAQF